MAIYSQKCQQKWLKKNNRGVGIKMSWVEKNRTIINHGGRAGWRGDYTYRLLLRRGKYKL